MNFMNLNKKMLQKFDSLLINLLILFKDECHSGPSESCWKD